MKLQVEGRQPGWVWGGLVGGGPWGGGGDGQGEKEGEAYLERCIC